MSIYIRAVVDSSLVPWLAVVLDTYNGATDKGSITHMLPKGSEEDILSQ